MIEPLFLKKKDIDNLNERNLEIGRGTDGIVYKTGHFKTRNELYKIYYSTSSFLDDVRYKQELDAEGVNIADNRRLFNEKCISNPICYYDKEDVRIAGENAVYNAIERQENINRTYLQKRPIYVGTRFSGAVLHYHRCCVPITYLKACPLRIQLWTLKELLLANKELIDNNIYPVDLKVNPNQPRTDNVLISWGLRPVPHIIDVDGKSAVYTEVPNVHYERKSYFSYKSLLLEILFDVNVETCEEEDLCFKKLELRNEGLSEDMVNSLLYKDNLLDFYELNGLLEDVKGIKLKTKKLF